MTKNENVTRMFMYSNCDLICMYWIVYADGSICLDILQNRWSPTYDVSAILTSIQVQFIVTCCCFLLILTPVICFVCRWVKTCCSTVARHQPNSVPLKIYLCIATIHSVNKQFLEIVYVMRASMVTAAELMCLNRSSANV